MEWSLASRMRLGVDEFAASRWECVQRTRDQLDSLIDIIFSD